MRQLTKKQKNLLANWQDKAGLTIQGTQAIDSWGDLSLQQMEILEAINDTEILSQETTRFLYDRSWEKINN